MADASNTPAPKPKFGLVPKSFDVSNVDHLEIVQTKPISFHEPKPEKAPKGWKYDSKNDQKFSVGLVVPEATAAGISAYMEFYSTNGPKHDGSAKDGAEFVAECVRKRISDNVNSYLDSGAIDLAPRFLPAISRLGFVDENEARASRFLAWTVANPGKQPGPTEMKEIFGTVA